MLRLNEQGSLAEQQYANPAVGTSVTLQCPRCCYLPAYMDSPCYTFDIRRCNLPGTLQIPSPLTTTCLAFTLRFQYEQVQIIA